MLCWTFHIFGRGWKQGGLRGRSQHLGWCIKPGEGIDIVPFVMSQSCLFYFCCSLFCFLSRPAHFSSQNLKSGASIRKDWRSHAKTHITEILEILHNMGPFNLMLLFLGLYWSAIFLEDEQSDCCICLSHYNCVHFLCIFDVNYLILSMMATLHLCFVFTTGCLILL